MSKNLCTTCEQIENGFTITRDVADLHHIFDELVQEDGVILKHIGNYDTRAGVTAKTHCNKFSVVSPSITCTSAQF